MCCSGLFPLWGISHLPPVLFAPLCHNFYLPFFTSKVVVLSDFLKLNLLPHILLVKCKTSRCFLNNSILAFPELLRLAQGVLHCWSGCHKWYLRHGWVDFESTWRSDGFYHRVLEFIKARGHNRSETLLRHRKALSQHFFLNYDAHCLHKSCSNGVKFLLFNASLQQCFILGE